jgi:tricorn protease
MFYKEYKSVWNVAVLLAVILFASSGFAQGILERPIMKYPDVHDTLVAFVYGGDIWTVPARGGVARRITIGEGQELYPKFSPDGSMIAFTADYDGNRDAYVMNIYGGDIKRLTYHPQTDHVIGWHPTKNKVIFRSARKGGYEIERLYMVSPDGTGLEDIPIHEIYFGTFSADGSKIAYTKTGRDERNWKRYFGGTAENIYEYDLVSKEWNRLTNYEGTDRFPMWHGDKIYFNSDRSYSLNIYSYDLNTGDITQVTSHSDFDVREPSMGGDQIVYELGGSLWLLNVNTGITAQIPISIKTDLPDRRPRYEDVKKYISGIDCSPEGKRAVIVARGDLYTVPEKNGPTRNLTKSSGSRERDAVWSPDGKWIAYLSDEGGEWQIHVIDPLGAKPSLTLTSYDVGYRHSLKWSPDSKKIAFADQTLSLYYIDIDTKNITKVDKAEYQSMDVSYDVKEISDYNL